MFFLFSAMESKMRSVWQTQQEVTYCLYGSKRNMMLNIFNSSNSPFYRFGQQNSKLPGYAILRNRQSQYD